MPRRAAVDARVAAPSRTARCARERPAPAPLVVDRGPESSAGSTSTTCGRFSRIRAPSALSAGSPRILVPPHETDCAGGRRRSERAYLHQIGVDGADPRHRRQDRQQRAADSRRHHLAQGLDAGGLEFLALVRRMRAADRQRLVAHAMAFFEQQHVLIHEFALGYLRFSGERMAGRQRDDEGFAKQRHHLDVVTRHRQRQQQRIESALAQPLDQVIETTQVVFVSLSPERDDVNRLREYLEPFDKRFVGGTASRETLARLVDDWSVATDDPSKPGLIDANPRYPGTLLLVGPDGSLRAEYLPPFDVPRLTADYLKTRIGARRAPLWTHASDAQWVKSARIPTMPDGSLLLLVRDPNLNQDTSASHD